MGSPTTELDTRFSDPDASATDLMGLFCPRRTLESRSSSGCAPSALTVARTSLHWWPCGWTSALYFSTGADEQKAVNLRHNAHVHPDDLVTSGTPPDVVVEGEATEVTDEGDAPAPGRRQDHEVGRALAFRAAQRPLSP